MSFPTPAATNHPDDFSANSVKCDGVIYISDSYAASEHRNIQAAIATHAQIDQRTGKSTLESNQTE